METFRQVVLLNSIEPFDSVLVDVAREADLVLEEPLILRSEELSFVLVESLQVDLFQIVTDFLGA